MFAKRTANIMRRFFLCTMRLISKANVRVLCRLLRFSGLCSESRLCAMSFAVCCAGHPRSACAAAVRPHSVAQRSSFPQRRLGAAPTLTHIKTWRQRATIGVVRRACARRASLAHAAATGRKSKSTRRRRRRRRRLDACLHMWHT